MSPEIARLDASPVRRWTGAIILGAVGLGLIYVAFAQPSESMLVRFAMPMLGGVLAYQAFRNLKATQQSLVVTQEGIWIAGGELLLSMDNISSVNRATFAMKPSNGFAITLFEPVATRWSPGMYWCVGRKVGIGGATNPSQAKAMSEVIAAMIAER